MHHYTESGLDNVYLVNGYEVHQTPYGEGVSIHNMDGLHRLIGRWLVELPKPLTGAELRFLRTEMDLSQKHLGELMGSNEQAVKRWEKGRAKAIPGLADRLVRVIYATYADGDGSVRQLVERLAELDQVDVASVNLRAVDDHWQMAA